MSSSTTTVKVQSGNDLRRITLPGKPGFAAVRDAVFRLFVYNRAHTNTGADLNLFWIDDDGDAITVASDADLAEAIASAKGCPPKFHLGRPTDAAASTASTAGTDESWDTGEAAAAATKTKTVATLSAFFQRGFEAPTRTTAGRNPDFRAALCAEIKSAKRCVLHRVRANECRETPGQGRTMTHRMTHPPITAHVALARCTMHRTLLRDIKAHGSRRVLNSTGSRVSLLRDIKRGVRLATCVDRSARPGAPRNPWWWATTRESLARKHFRSHADRDQWRATHGRLAAAGNAAAAAARARVSTATPAPTDATAVSNAAATPRPGPSATATVADARAASLQAFRNDLCHTRAELKKSSTPPSVLRAYPCFAASIRRALMKELHTRAELKKSSTPPSVLRAYPCFAASIRRALMKELVANPTASQIQARATQKYGSVAVVNDIKRSNAACQIRARARSTAMSAAAAAAARGRAATAAVLPGLTAITARHQAFQRYQFARLLASIRAAHGSPTGRSADAARCNGWVELSNTQQPPSPIVTAAPARAPAAEQNVFVKAYMSWA